VKFLHPEEALRQFGVYGAQDVADFGAGAGHFSLSAAKRLEGGRLYAIDVEKEMLARLVSEAKSRGMKNLHGIRGDLSRVRGVPMADETLDKAIATNILFQIDDRDAFASEVKRLLKPQGKILIVDWTDTHAFGPHHAHKVSADTALALFKRHGFTKECDIDAGDCHYGMILVRN
jgi:ubiquinone/menaquinone biosynthesis C-methylase UbiE